MDKKRRTGRTTRMVREAVKLARQGRAVYIIALARQRRMIEATIEAVQDAPEEHLSIKVETPGSPGNFDWQTMRLRGAHPNCVVLVDHFCIEETFAPVLEMLTRFDAPDEPVDADTVSPKVI